MAVVVVILGLMTTLAFKTTSSTSNDSSCAANNQAQLVAIQNAINQFVTKNQRYPVPAGRSVPIGNPLYGAETPMPASLGNIDRVANGTNPLLFGALPFVALGLPATFAADCWGNKFSYVVTESLTTSAETGGYKDPATVGGLTVNSGTIASPSLMAPKVAYSVISHGENGGSRGGVAKNYTGGGHGWCSIGAAIDTENCDLTNGTLFLSTYNKTNGANYFDDSLVFGLKVSTTAGASKSNIYCWGGNADGQLGDGTTTNRATIEPTTLPADVNYFTGLAQGYSGFCALSDAGKVYCWGKSDVGAAKVPTLNPSPAGVVLTQIDGSSGAYAALDAAGRAYQWGAFSFGNPNGYTLSKTPELVSQPNVPAGVFFKQITVGFYHTFYAIGSDSKPYGWSYAMSSSSGSGSAWGDPSSSVSFVTPQAILNLPAGAKWVQVSSSDIEACALRDDGKTWCWGSGDEWGNMGRGPNTRGGAPRSPAPSLGGPYLYTDNGYGGRVWIAADGSGYAAGLGNFGTSADGLSEAAHPLYETPNKFFGGIKFADISVAAGYAVDCGVDQIGEGWCWGMNNYGQLGTGSVGGTYNSIPQKVVPPSGVVFTKIVADAFGACAIAAVPDASAKCAASVFTWQDSVQDATSNGSTCSTNIPALDSGNYYNAVDNSAPGTGDIRLRCNNGTLQVIGRKTCTPSGAPTPPSNASCSAATFSWNDNGLTCTGNFPSTVHGSTSTVEGMNNQTGDSGTGHATCNNGTWTNVNGTCLTLCGYHTACSNSHGYPMGQSDPVYCSPGHCQTQETDCGEPSVKFTEYNCF